jgi:type I restriction enzyme, S subunit
MIGRSLSDYVQIVMGQSPAGQTCNTIGSGLPLLNGPTEYGPHHPTPVQFTTDARKRALCGDLLFCVRGSTTGRMNWADREYAIGRGIAAIRHKTTRELQPFVRAVIDYSLSNLLAQATGSTFPNVSSDQLANIWWPPLTVDAQRAVAHILGTLDNKIELSRQMNETLEAIARALFKSWFVDFDPVRAKAENRDPNLPKPVADLFPTTFEDSELEKIPKGWEVGVLDKLTHAALGGDWGGDAQDAETSTAALCIRGADIPDLQRGGVGKMPVRFLKRSSLAKRRLGDGDLVIEVSGGSPTQSTGRPVLVSHELLDRLQLPLVCSNFCRLLKLRSPVLSKFVYLWLRWLYSNDELLQFENGTTGIKNFAFTLFSSSYRLVLPPVLLLEAFDRHVALLLRRQQAGAVESDILAALRGKLLPMLISGELHVEHAERFINERT